MKLTILPVLAVCGLAACQPTSQTTETTVAAPMTTSFAQQVATANCENSIPERDNWLRDERPPVAEVVRSYNSRGIDPEASSVFRAYRAYMNAGQDHNAAGAVYGDRYANAAACFA